MTGKYKAQTGVEVLQERTLPAQVQFTFQALETLAVNEFLNDFTMNPNHAHSTAGTRHV
jgi:hypothetical protein